MPDERELPFELVRPEDPEERVDELLRVDVPELLRTLVEFERVALRLDDDEVVPDLVETPELVVEDWRPDVTAVELRVLLLLVRALLLVRVVVPVVRVPDVRVVDVLPAETAVLLRPPDVTPLADVRELTGVRVLLLPDTRCASAVRRFVAPLLRTENELFG